MEQEPRSATRLLFIVAALSIAGLLIGIGSKTNSPRATIVSAVPTWEPTVGAFEEVDTDGDNLPDWQETLLGTDPTKSDSDGDGKMDSFEPRASIALQAAESENAKTTTESAADRLLRQYLTLKQANAYSTERGEQIATGIIESIRATVAFEPYDEGDIQTIPATIENKLAYQQQLREAVGEFLDLQDSEIALFANYTSTKNEYYLTRLEERASVYESVAAQMIKTPVPNDAIIEHLEVANGLAYFGAVLRDLGRFGRDPLAALSLLRAYNDAEAYVGTTFAALSAYLNTKSL